MFVFSYSIQGAKIHRRKQLWSSFSMLILDLLLWRFYGNSIKDEPFVYGTLKTFIFIPDTSSKQHLILPNEIFQAVEQVDCKLVVFHDFFLKRLN